VLYKSTSLELVDIKAGSEGMLFTAYASTFGNEDHGGDVIEKGAFAKTLKDPNRDRPLLWQHDPRVPIGIEQSLKEDGRGLIGTWELVDTQQGSDAYKLLKKGAIRSMSIGYIPKTWELQEEATVRVLKEIDLLENSVVSIPMNDQARVQSVKHLCEACYKSEQNFDDMTLAELVGVLKSVGGAVSDRTRSLLEKLSAGDFALTDTKRTDLEAFLETFSGIDAVRHDAEAVLAHRPTIDPKNDRAAALALTEALELRARKWKLRGVHLEV